MGPELTDQIGAGDTPSDPRLARVFEITADGFGSLTRDELLEVAGLCREFVADSAPVTEGVTAQS